MYVLFSSIYNLFALFRRKAPFTYSLNLGCKERKVKEYKYMY